MTKYMDIIDMGMYEGHSTKTESYFLPSGNTTKLRNKNVGEFFKILTKRL